MPHNDSSDFPITQRRLRRWSAGLGVVLILVLGAIVLLAEPTESPSAAVSPDAFLGPFPERALFEYGNDLPLASPRPGKVLVAGSKNEVCGLGNVPVGQSVEDLERGNAPKIAQAAESLVRRLGAGRNPRDQVAALMFSIMQPSAYALFAAAAAEDTACRSSSEGATCDQAHQQNLRAKQEEAIRMAPVIAELVKSAASTSDPAIYAQALYVCQHWGREMTVCNVIKVEQWARLEPDNMQPWLQLADRAYERKDTEGLTDALFRASKAKTDRSYAYLTLVSLLSTGGGELSGLELRSGVSAGAGIAAAWTLPGFQAVSAYCSAERVVDANRRQACDALINTMVSQSESLLGMAIAARLGGRVGWSNEQVESIRNQARALGEFAWSNQLGLPDPQSMYAEDCGMYQRTASRYARTFEIGEMGAVRELALRRGFTVQQVTQAYWQAQATRQLPPVTPQSGASLHAQ